MAFKQSHVNVHEASVCCEVSRERRINGRQQHTLCASKFNCRSLLIGSTTATPEATQGPQKLLANESAHGHEPLGDVRVEISEVSSAVGQGSETCDVYELVTRGLEVELNHSKQHARNERAERNCA